MQKMFYPQSVAVVGASNSDTNMGRNIIQNLVNWGYEGEVCPVNPRGEDVLGLKGYASLSEIGRPIDLVVAFVPAKVVPGVMDECAALGVTRMAVPSGGFSEYGESGDELTRLVAAKAVEYGIRFVGPNGLTIINTENGLCLPFLTLKKREPGHISVVSQSGGVGLSLMMFLDNAAATFNKFISVGNKVSMDELDFLEYLGDDPGTRVICLFLESVVRGRRFGEVASRIDKPILIYKANTTEAGARTAASHTAALANDDAVVEGMFRQAGIIRVRSIRRLVDMARAFELPPIRGNRIAVVSQAGGYTVLCADEAYRRGFSFPALAPAFLDGMKEYVRSDVIRMGNPLDLGDIHSTDEILYALDKVLGQRDIDGVALVLLRRSDARYDGAYARMQRPPYADLQGLMSKHHKPISMCLLTQSAFLREVRSEVGYPIFEIPEDAVEALGVLRDHYSRRPA
ncbi:MAG: CoA-binding protein [Actinobacteria bacterium]|nr:CoA-binding protein [Actinomycetota bacterium]MBU2685997.1 CoA-binding protein [Actinomycetota bacterium]